jgi:molybdate transport system substrate-binding protein
MTSRKLFAISIVLILSLPCGSATAAEVSVAVAANFTDAARQIAQRFHESTGHSAEISYGSTGKLYAQIQNGAPFEVFLAADTKRPAKAEEEGLAVPGSRFIYARGKLALWSAKSGRFGDGAAYLRGETFHHLALANPETAPYGLAARQVMEHLDLLPALQSKLVQGDSIAQTFQFVATGNAEVGFVAYSQVTAWQGEPGSLWEVPMEYYAPIEQAAVLLKTGADNPAAQAFLDFLKSDAAREIITAYGYGTE